MKFLFILSLVVLYFTGCGEDKVVGYIFETKQDTIYVEEKSDTIWVEISLEVENISPANIYLIYIDYGDGFGNQPYMDLLFRGSQQPEYVFQLPIDRNLIIGKKAKLRVDVLRERTPHPGYNQSTVFTLSITK